MKSVVRKLLLLFVSTSFVALVAAPAGATHSWGPYHWASNVSPVPLKTNYTVTSDWIPRLDAVVADWNVSSKISLTAVQLAASAQARKKCSPVSGQLRVCNANYGYNGWLGLATIHIDGARHIIDGTAKLNDSYFNGTSTYNTETERRHVACQEIGHLFGLGHQSETGASLNTCMDYYLNKSNTDTLSISPNAHDYEQLDLIYSHQDSYSTWKTTSNTSVKSRSENGVTTIEFIFWTPGRHGDHAAESH